MSVPEPRKITTPWANAGLKNAIPAAADPVTGKAGFDLGFAAINMTAKEAGGIPPFGQDFNGILFEITNVLRYSQAGGAPTYSAALSSAIGGYPKGATIIGNDGLTEYRSLVDSNTNDPDSVITGWAKNDSDRFGASMVTNGYQKLPNGLIIQWGRSNFVSADGNNGTLVTFPIAFPNVCLGVVGSDWGVTGTGSSCLVYAFGNITATNMRNWARSPSSAGAYQSGSGYFMAIGY